MFRAFANEVEKGKTGGASMCERVYFGIVEDRPGLVPVMTEAEAEKTNSHDFVIRRGKNPIFPHS